LDAEKLNALLEHFEIAGEALEFADERIRTLSEQLARMREAMTVVADRIDSMHNGTGGSFDLSELSSVLRAALALPNAIATQQS
jgi:hypothetical protein